MDTYEHITDYKSAADHTITLQKWQEMDVPLTVQPTKTQSIYSDEPTTSVFENSIDSTVPSEAKLTGVDGKWRFKGPWLAGQNEGEFVDYLKTDVRQRKTAFQEFLRQKCAIALNKVAREKAEGDEEPVVIRAQDVTEVQLNDYVKRLRKERKDLYAHINAFLDLAPMSGNEDVGATSLQIQQLLDSASRGGDQLTVFEAQLKDLPQSQSPYRKSGPPKTHPSAGLSYSRTAARVHNHPEFGPQSHKTPVEARIVLPRIFNQIVPVLGVGGFTAQVPGGNASFQLDKNAKQIPGLQRIEPDKVGGSKTWVHPQSASINSEGKVQLNVVHADEMAVAVKQGKTDELKKVNAPYGGFNLSPPTRSSRQAGHNDYFASSGDKGVNSLFKGIRR